jgi:hypothetical protein
VLTARWRCARSRRRGAEGKQRRVQRASQHVGTHAAVKDKARARARVRVRARLVLGALGRVALRLGGLAARAPADAADATAASACADSVPADGAHTPPRRKGGGPRTAPRAPRPCAPAACLLRARAPHRTRRHTTARQRHAHNARSNEATAPTNQPCRTRTPLARLCAPPRASLSRRCRLPRWSGAA